MSKKNIDLDTDIKHHILAVERRYVFDDSKLYDEKILDEICRLKKLAKVREFLFDRYDKDPEDAAKWRTTRNALGGNRYCLTILFAAAQHIALSDQSIVDGGRKAGAFIRHTVDQVRNVSVQVRAQIVLEAVLDCYRKYHLLGSPERDAELHHHLLRHLAVINAPVGANVLVRLPEIRAYFAALRQELPISRRRTVASALATLSERGLVFRLSPHPWPGGSFPPSGNGDVEPGGWPPEREYRYALHRLVHRYCISKLGSSSSDAVTVSSFAPSLYASMPSEVPRLNHATYRFLSELMVGLSQYPDIPHKQERNEPWLFSTNDRSTRIEALRAALSLVRSSFSISVVSRFEDYKSIPGERERRKRGYYETYKVRLRWLLRKSWELFDQSELDDANEPYRPDRPWKKLNALYRDEIVWLYNEVGLICLVQGNLRDAVAHLRQAIQLNRPIEGMEDGGRQHNLMSLNLAVVQIERGRLDSARRRLQAIRQSEADVKGSVFHIALGYLGLILHLSGDVQGAEIAFNEALTNLARTGDARACAVFQNHLARLVSHRDYAEARDHLRKAREYAEAGGHQDIRHHVMYSEAKISQLGAPDPSERADADHAKLRAVEDYARLMGMPSLLCDVTHLRARMLMSSGDTATSGRMLIHAMALAQRNGMELRLNDVMITYAEILLRRGRLVSAERLLYSALEMAKRSGCNTVAVRVQDVLERTEVQRRAHRV